MLFDEGQLRASVQQFLGREYPFEIRRNYVTDTIGAGRGCWAGFAALGWLGMGLSEDVGGLGGGPADLAVLSEELGRGLVAEPWIGCAVLAPMLVDFLGTPAQRAALLPAVAAGTTILALAHDEASSRGEIDCVTTCATQTSDGYVLDGKKLAVAGGPVADQLLVTARTSGKGRDADGISLFLLDPAVTPGASLHGYRGYDGQPLAELTLDAASLPRTALIGPEGGALPALERAHTLAILAHCAFALGVMDRAFAATADYLKTRRQFGRALADFQVLRHRLVDAHIEIEKTRAILGAVQTELSCHPDLRQVARLRLVTTRAAHLVSRACTQLHGGIGLTEAYHVGQCTRWLTAARVQFGTADWWRRLISSDATTAEMPDPAI